MKIQLQCWNECQVYQSHKLIRDGVAITTLSLSMVEILRKILGSPLSERRNEVRWLRICWCGQWAEPRSFLSDGRRGLQTHRCILKNWSLFESETTPDLLFPDDSIFLNSSLTIFLHDLKKLNNYFTGGSQKDLSLSALLSVRHGLQTIG